MLVLEDSLLVYSAASYWLFYYVICVIVVVVFFFQAEDGIRDLVRSRGLGDVYKRQTINGAGAIEVRATHRATDSTLARIIHLVEKAEGPVSYTHLTLPTSDLV